MSPVDCRALRRLDASGFVRRRSGPAARWSREPGPLGAASRPARAAGRQGPSSQHGNDDHDSNRCSIRHPRQLSRSVPRRIGRGPSGDAAIRSTISGWQIDGSRRRSYRRPGSVPTPPRAGIRHSRARCRAVRSRGRPRRPSCAGSRRRRDRSRLSMRARPAPSSIVAWPTGRAASERTKPLAGDFSTILRAGRGQERGVVDGARVAALGLRRAGGIARGPSRRRSSAGRAPALPRATPADPP